MNKKGFTLIELLAVILILGIIALIAIPTVNKIIEESKRGAFKTSVENLLRSVEQNCQVERLKGKKITDKYTFKDGKSSQFLNVKGDLPKSGSIIMDDSCNAIVGVSNGTYFASKEYDSDKIKISMTYLCKRATVLHEEECTQTSESYYCKSAGYTLDGTRGTTTIKYGNQTTKNGKLVSGDAFDCDVNGDGIYDSETERFYYVNDYYNTKTKELETDKASLIYYSNVARTQEGKLVPNSTEDGLVSYSNQGGLKGPVDAIINLPKRDDWINISLINTERAILTADDLNYVNETQLPTNFSYEGYAARLLTYQEVIHIIKYNSAKRLDSFNYFLENTKYASSNNVDYWIENYHSTRSGMAYNINSSNRNIGFTAQHINFGVRPVIDVYKSQIDY